MRRIALMTLAFALCAGCSERQRDLGQARTSRSILAEWALLADLRGGLPDIYVREMRATAQEELGKVASSAQTAGSTASREIAAVSAVSGDPPSADLQARMRAAHAIEQSLEAR